MRLIDICDALAQIVAELELHDGEVLPDMEERMDAICSESLPAKVENTAAFIRASEMDAAMLKQEIARLDARRKRLEARARWMRDYMTRCLLRAGQRSVRTVRFTVSVTKSKRVALRPDAEVPERWLKPQPPKVDKAGIKRALESGEELGFARLEETEGLVVR